MSFNCNQTLSAADLSTLNCLSVYYLVITMMTAFFLPFVLNSCASYIWVCVGGGGWLQEIKLLMDKFSQVKCTGLDIKSSWNCRKAGETAFKRTRLRSLGSKKAAAVRKVVGQEHVGTAAGECVPPTQPPVLHWGSESQEWIWLSLGHVASSWLEGVMKRKICFFSSFHWKQAPGFHVAVRSQMVRV